MSDFIKKQIERKNNYNIPYYATKNSVTKTMTDMDHFPYTRYFRGVYNESNPVVMDREAGFRERQDHCYIPSAGGDYKSPLDFTTKFQDSSSKTIPAASDASIEDTFVDSKCSIANNYM